MTITINPICLNAGNNNRTKNSISTNKATIITKTAISITSTMFPSLVAQAKKIRVCEIITTIKIMAY